eukprot:Skav214995  [mRNA]  locus=scaffold508:738590:743089:- [translate_table: standard]
MVDTIFDSTVQLGDHHTLIAEVVVWDKTHMEHQLRFPTTGRFFQYVGPLPATTVVVIVNARVDQIQPTVVLASDDLTEIFERPVHWKHDMKKVVEICSGFGCMGVGLEHAGFQISLRCDWSEAILQLAEANFDSPILCADINEVGFVGRLLNKCSTAGVLAAGVACQPYSRLGDQKQHEDPRSSTMPRTMEIGFTCRFMVIILECVPEAGSCTWVQQLIQKFTTRTAYRATQTELHLQNAWPARRSRWWSVLTHPMITPTPIPDVPTVQPAPMILHLLDRFRICSQEELAQLQLDLYDLRQFEELGTESRHVPMQGQMATSLHSCGNQLTGCPCGCRSYGFTHSRLQQGGLHGLLIALEGISINGTNRYQNQRHIHPDELALFNGMPPGYDYQNKLKLALCMFGQLASPIQSVWVGQHVMHFLSEARLVPATCQSVSPSQALSTYMQHVLECRDRVFGEQVGSHARAFTTMVGNQDFTIPTIAKPTVRPSQKPGYAADQAATTTTPVLPSAVHGGVSGFESNRKRKEPPTASPMMSPVSNAMVDSTPSEAKMDTSPRETAESDSAFAEPVSVPEQSMPTEVQPDRETSHPVHDGHASVEAMQATLSVSQPTAVTDPHDTHHDDANTITFYVMTSAYPQPYKMQCARGTTVGKLTRAEERIEHIVQPVAPKTQMGVSLALGDKIQPDETICLHADFSEPRCPMHHTQAMPKFDPCPMSRMQQLFEQQSWVALDEFDYYMTSLHRQPSVVTMPSVVWQPNDPEWVEQWTDELQNMLGDGDTLVSAYISESHWIPLIVARAGSKLTAITTEGEDIARRVMQPFADGGFEVTHVSTPLPHAFPGDCGFQCFAWIVSTLANESHEPMTQSRAISWRDLFRTHIIVRQTADQPCQVVPCGGTLSDSQATQQLQQILANHGVWESRLADRAQLIINRLGIPTVKTIVTNSANKWADLKAATNRAQPPLRIIQQDELDAQIASRTNQKKQFGKKPTKTTQKPEPTNKVSIQAKDLEVPEGVFCQQGGESLGPVTQAQLGPLAKGIIIVDQADSEAILKLQRPLTQHGLGVIVLATPANQGMHSTPAFRFPAICKLTQEPVLVAGHLYQLGAVMVGRNEPANKIAVEEQSAEALRCLVYRDQVGSLWESMQKQPVKAVFQRESRLMPDDGESPVIDVWDRQWLTKKFEKTQAHRADIFAFSLRVLSSHADQVVASSGSQGVYFEPRTPCGRYPSSCYHVTWLGHVDFQNARFAHQTSPQSTTLVRHGDRYGLRSDTMNAKEIHQKHKPGEPLLLGGEEKMYSLGPMPFATTKEGVTKLLKLWDWDAKAVQPRGRSSDQAGIDWLIQGVEDPGYWIYHLKHGDVLITRLSDPKVETKAPAVSVVASRKTMEQLQKSQHDPWVTHDPWQRPSSTTSNPPPSLATTQQLNTLEASLEKRIASAVNQTLAARDQDEPMESAAVDQRMQRLEQHMHQMQSTQQQFDHRWTPKPNVLEPHWTPSYQSTSTASSR